MIQPPTHWFRISEFRMPPYKAYTTIVGVAENPPRCKVFSRYWSWCRFACGFTFPVLLYKNPANRDGDVFPHCQTKTPGRGKVCVHWFESTLETPSSKASDLWALEFVSQASKTIHFGLKILRALCKIVENAHMTIGCSIHRKNMTGCTNFTANFKYPWPSSTRMSSGPQRDFYWNMIRIFSTQCNQFKQLVVFCITWIKKSIIETTQFPNSSASYPTYPP